MNKVDPERHLHFAVLATDVVLFTVHDDKIFVRIQAVNRPPHFPEGSRAMPGGLIDPKETARESALRILEVKGKISKTKIYAEQLYTFSELERDPRGRVVAVAYLALVPWDNLSEDEKENKAEVWWQDINTIGKLAYDHNEILGVALRRLRSRASYSTIISKLMPREFTFSELEVTFNCILGKSLDRRNLYKKIQKLNIITPLAEKRLGTPSRPAQLFKFSSENIEILEVI